MKSTPRGAHQPQADQPLPWALRRRDSTPESKVERVRSRAHQKLLPQPGESGVAAAALEEGDPQLRLQLADGVAQAGLSDEQVLRRPGVVAGVGQLHKVAQM